MHLPSILGQLKRADAKRTAAARRATRLIGRKKYIRRFNAHLQDYFIWGAMTSLYHSMASYCRRLDRGEGPF